MRIAALGKARSLEASYDLPKAIEQYKLVTTNWPGTAEAEEAKLLGEALERPEAAAFYKELYSYAPTKFTLPPLGTDAITPPVSGLTGPLGPGPLPPPLSVNTMPLESAPIANSSTQPATGVKELPGDVFTKPADTKSPAAAPKPPR
jgi:hypothetical protein